MAAPTVTPTAARTAPELTPKLLDRVVTAVFEDAELATHGTPAEIGAYSLDSAAWAEQTSHIIANTLNLPPQADLTSSTP